MEQVANEVRKSGNCLIGDEAFAVATGIARAEGRDIDDPACVGAPHIVQGWLTKGWSAQAILWGVPVDLTKAEPIVRPDPRRPGPPPSWPSWVSVRLASLREEGEKQSSLPPRLSLQPHERRALEAHCGYLSGLAAQTPTLNVDAEAESHVAVTNMMLALPAERATADSVAAQAEAYKAALDDVPSWAVVAAMRLWYRGEAGEGHDYNWRPKPAALRKVAARIAHESVGYPVWQMMKLLAAKRRREVPEAEREAMKAKLRALGLGLEEPGKRKAA
jgi:hypothetical protein